MLKCNRSKLQKSPMINSIMLGTTNVMIRYVEVQQALVTEISHDKQYYVGHNQCYDQVC